VYGGNDDDTVIVRRADMGPGDIDDLDGGLGTEVVLVRHPENGRTDLLRTASRTSSSGRGSSTTDRARARTLGPRT
jgi:hypothetical protein